MFLHENYKDQAKPVAWQAFQESVKNKLYDIRNSWVFSKLNQERKRLQKPRNNEEHLAIVKNPLHENNVQEFVVHLFCVVGKLNYMVVCTEKSHAEANLKGKQASEAVKNCQV